jgi:hypothetical protein
VSSRANITEECTSLVGIAVVLNIHTTALLFAITLQIMLERRNSFIGC